MQAQHLRAMSRVTRKHSWQHHISTQALGQQLGLDVLLIYLIRCYPVAWLCSPSLRKCVVQRTYFGGYRALLPASLSARVILGVVTHSIEALFLAVLSWIVVVEYVSRWAGVLHVVETIVVNQSLLQVRHPLFNILELEFQFNL